MAATKSVVIWIENKAERKLHEELKTWLSSKGFELCHVENVDKLAEKLDGLKVAEVRGFIVDMMLDGPNNLSSFGIKDVTWNHDVADAGRILLNHVLKAKASPYIDIPTLVLSVRPDLDKTQIIAYPKTALVMKRDLANQDWHKNLRKWVDEL